MEFITYNLYKSDSIEKFLQYMDSTDHPIIVINDEAKNALKEITEEKEPIIVVDRNKMYDSESLIGCLNYIKENKDFALYSLNPNYCYDSVIKIRFSKYILSLSEFIGYLEIVINDPMDKDTSVLIEHQPSCFDPGPIIYKIWFIENNIYPNKYCYNIRDVSAPNYFTGILGEGLKWYGSSSLYSLEDYKNGFAERLKVKDLDMLIKEKMLEYFNYCINKLS